jgi:hypothetical protein
MTGHEMYIFMLVSRRWSFKTLAEIITAELRHDGVTSAADPKLPNVEHTPN